MTTRIASSTQTLGQLREGMGIRKDEPARYAGNAEIRATPNGATKVKTGRAFFTREASRAAHRQLGYARVAAAFRESLRAAGARAEELGQVEIRARHAVGFPDGAPVTWKTFVAAEAHVDALAALHGKVPGLSLLEAEEVLEAGRAYGERGSDTKAQAAVGQLVKDGRTSAEQGWKQVLRVPAAGTWSSSRAAQPSAVGGASAVKAPAGAAISKPEPPAADAVTIHSPKPAWKRGLTEERAAEMERVLHKHPELLRPENSSALARFAASVRVNLARSPEELVQIPLTEIETARPL